MQINNPLLQKTIQGIEAKVPPELQSTFQKIVLAGQKVMYSPQTHGMMISQLKSNPNPAEAVGEGIAKLFGILMHQSHGTLNMKAAIPAMTVLLCDALDFVEKLAGIKATPQLLAEATKEMGSSLLQIMGVTPEKLNQMMAKQQAGGTPAGGSPMGGMPAGGAPAAPAGIVGSAAGG